jgi:hypothetical protein
MQYKDFGWIVCGANGRELSDETEIELIDGVFVDDGEAAYRIPYENDSKAAAQEYVDRGYYGEINKTTWVNVRTWRELRYVVDGKTQKFEYDEKTHTIAIHPDEPYCTESDHDWHSPHKVVGGIKSNPGVQGHGGGVLITEVCVHCGCYRVMDTWAQNPETGEQGLESVEYLDADDQSLAWIEEIVRT